jgi:uncharacterized membrane protein YkoI
MHGSQARAYETPMLPAGGLLTIALALGLVSGVADAAPAARGAQKQDIAGLECLTPAQRRELVATRKVVPLATAIRAARGMAEARSSRSRAKSDVISARLCRGPNGLVYRLTVLARDGKVARLTVDAASGKLVSD